MSYHHELSGETTEVCLARANSRVAQIEAAIDDLQKTWHPTGLFTPAEILKMYMPTVTLCKVSLDRLRKISPPDEDDVVSINTAANRIEKWIKSGDRFRSAYIASQVPGSKIKIISAPDFKDWVIAAHLAGVEGLTIEAMLECMDDSFLLSYYETTKAMFRDLKKVAGQVASAVAAIGSAIIKVPRDIASGFELVGTLIKLAMVGGAAFLGYELYKKYKEK
jgi:hypothetical protein